MADIRIQCTVCMTDFLFVGIPHGMNLDGVSSSPDGKELRIALTPDQQQ